jgi:D-mannonate dehydratase
MTELEQIVKQLNELTADQLWDLAKLLNRTSPVNANILKADLDFVESM